MQRLHKIITASALFVSISGHAQWNGLYFHADEESEIAVLNKDTVIAVTMGGGHIHRSTDGGQSWSFYQTMFENSWFLDVDFPSQTVGYACGGTAFGQHTNVLAKTTDAGMTWDSLTSNNYPGYSFTKVEFLNADTGFIALESTDILRTMDGGMSFNLLPITGAITEMVSKPNQDLFIATSKYLGPNTYRFAIDFSTDLGNTWTNVYVDTMSGTSGLNHRVISCLNFVDNNIGYAVGGNGLFLKTVDGGNTWTSSFIPPYSALTTVHFVSDQVGYINNAGGMYRSDDGGQSWAVQNVFPPTIIQKISFANDTIGFAIADYNIFKTTNGGVFVQLDEIEISDGIHVYPNPAADFLHITSDKEQPHLKGFALYGLDGTRLLEGSLEEPAKISVAHLTVGSYYLVLHTADQKTYRQLIILQ